MESVGSRVGMQFGPYRLTRLLGSGGFGEVHAAHDTDTKLTNTSKGYKTTGRVLKLAAQ